MANLIFAWANGEVTMEAGQEKEEFLGWLETTLEAIPDLFCKRRKPL